MRVEDQGNRSWRNIIIRRIRLIWNAPFSLSSNPIRDILSIAVPISFRGTLSGMKISWRRKLRRRSKECITISGSAPSPPKSTWRAKGLSNIRLGVSFTRTGHKDNWKSETETSTLTILLIETPAAESVPAVPLPARSRKENKDQIMKATMSTRWSNMSWESWTSDIYKNNAVQISLHNWHKILEASDTFSN